MMHIPTWRRALIWLVCLGGLLFALPNLFYDRVERSNDARAARWTTHHAGIRVPRLQRRGPNAPPDRHKGPPCKASNLLSR